MGEGRLYEEARLVGRAIKYDALFSKVTDSI